MKVGLYMRRSGESQEESLNTQLELLEAEGKRKDWEIVARYRDTISGTVPPKDRPAFRQLRGAVKRGDIDTVAVVRVDRISRSGVVHMVQTVEELHEQGIGLISLREPMLSVYGPQAKLVLSIMAAVAEYEREMILQRTREGRERARARGVKFGRKPVLVDRGRVAAMRELGLTYRKIAEELGVSLGKVHNLGSVSEDEETSQ